MLTLKGNPMRYAVNQTTYVKKTFSLANGKAPTSRRPVIVVLFEFNNLAFFPTAFYIIASILL